jgi:hypothetical protein
MNDLFPQSQETFAEHSANENILRSWVTVKKETYMATDFPNNTSRLHKTEKDTTVKASDVSKIDKMNARSKRKAEKERDRINND